MSEMGHIVKPEMEAFMLFTPFMTPPPEAFKQLQRGVCGKFVIALSEKIGSFRMSNKMKAIIRPRRADGSSQAFRD